MDKEKCGGMWGFFRKLIWLLLLIILYHPLFSNGLDGNYTINAKAPASDKNYLNFKSFFSDLNTGKRFDGVKPNGPGILNSVEVEVVKNSGPYVEQITISEIPGSSDSKRVKVKGNGETIEYTPVIAAESHIILFENCRYLTLENLKVIGKGARFGRNIQLTKGSSQNKIIRCELTLPNLSGPDPHTGYIIVANGTQSFLINQNPGENNSFLFNTMAATGPQKPKYGIAMLYPDTGNYQSNLIIGNQIRDFNHSGIYGYYSQNHFIVGNEIENRSALNPGPNYGMFFYNVGKMGHTQIDSNYIHGLSSGKSETLYGIYFYGSGAFGTGDYLIRNNKIEILNSQYASYGLYNYFPKNALKGKVELSGNILRQTCVDTASVGQNFAMYNYFIETSQISSFKIDRNRVEMKCPKYATGFYNYFSNSETDSAISFSNNIVSIMAGYFVNLLYIDGFNSNAKFNVCFNTLYSANYDAQKKSTGTKNLAYLYYTKGVFKNNHLFSAENGGEVAGVNAIGTSIQFDHNNLYLNNNGGMTNYGNGSKGKLEKFIDYQSKMGGAKDLNLNPEFKNPSGFDFYPTQVSVLRKGVPIVGIKDDIFGRKRDQLNPDIGAVESDASPTLKIQNPKEIEFSLYPNPASNGKIFLIFPATEKGCELEIIDLQGKSVLKIRLGAVTDKTEIDCAHLKSGIYLFKISQDEKSHFKKVVISGI